MRQNFSVSHLAFPNVQVEKVEPFFMACICSNGISIFIFVKESPLFTSIQ